MNLSFGRSDFIAVKVALIVAMVGAVVSTLGYRGLAWLRGEALEGTVDTGVPGAGDGLELRDGVILEWSNSAEVTVPDAGAGTWVAAMLPDVATMLAVIVAAATLWALVSRIQRGTPFAQGSVRLLRGLAIVGLVYAFALPSLKGIANIALLEAAVVKPGTTFEISLGVELTVFFAAMVCAVLAEAFAVGVRMQRDVEGLV